MSKRAIATLACTVLLALAACAEMRDGLAGPGGRSDAVEAQGPSPDGLAAAEEGAEGAEAAETGDEDTGGEEAGASEDAGPKPLEMKAETEEEPAPEPLGAVAPRSPFADLDPEKREMLEKERRSCERKGGRYGNAGGSKIFACVRNTRDGNKTCSNSGQCEGYCLARSRTCSPFTPLFGCHEVIGRTGARQTVCMQ